MSQNSRPAVATTVGVSSNSATSAVAVTMATMGSTIVTSKQSTGGGGDDGSKAASKVQKCAEIDILTGKERSKPSSTVRSLNFDDPELGKKVLPGNVEKKDEPKGKKRRCKIFSYRSKGNGHQN